MPLSQKNLCKAALKKKTGAHAVSTAAELDGRSENIEALRTVEVRTTLAFSGAFLAWLYPGRDNHQVLLELFVPPSAALHSSSPME